MPENGSDYANEAEPELPIYPDTAETGETYDLEFQETEPYTMGKPAEKAAGFPQNREQQSSSADKMKR